MRWNFTTHSVVKRDNAERVCEVIVQELLVTASICCQSLLRFSVTKELICVKSFLKTQYTLVKNYVNDFRRWRLPSLSVVFVEGSIDCVILPQERKGHWSVKTACGLQHVLICSLPLNSKNARFLEIKVSFLNLLPSKVGQS